MLNSEIRSRSLEDLLRNSEEMYTVESDEADKSDGECMTVISVVSGDVHIDDYNS